VKKSLLNFLVVATIFFILNAVQAQNVGLHKKRISNLLLKEHGLLIINDFSLNPPGKDWLVHAVHKPVELLLQTKADSSSARLLLTNGLIAREFYISENLACVEMRNLSNGAQYIRAIKPEARIMIDNIWYEIGGLKGQPEASYLLESWYDNLDPKHIERWKKIAAYAAKKGIIMGGYELQVASRGRGKEYDCIDPKTGNPGSLFGQSVCIASDWKDIYYPKTWDFFDQTGFKSYNMDGPYHGDPCASKIHKYHRGLEDSQWQHWKTQVEVIHELQRRNMYIPIPDWYFLNGQSATGMGYREVSANLTPQQQLLLGRQYVYDGTWHKIPTMGWMTLQLVGFYTNDPKVGLEPLSKNVDRYERGLVLHLGSGCQFSVRGNRLYDTPETKAMVEKWVIWFKKYRNILTSDIIHLGRPTGRNLDCILHVNAQKKIKGLAVIFNPTNKPIKKMFNIPLYYTGLTENARVREQEGEFRTFQLNRGYEIKIPVEIRENGFSWFVIEGGGVQ